MAGSNAPLAGLFWVPDEHMPFYVGTGELPQAFEPWLKKNGNLQSGCFSGSSSSIKYRANVANCDSLLNSLLPRRCKRPNRQRRYG